MAGDWRSFYFHRGPLFVGSEKSFEEAVYAAFGAPFDGTSSYRPGSRFAPTQLRIVSEYLELPRESLISLCDLGDLPPTNSVEAMLRRVGEAVEKIREADKIPVILGGEHTVTLASASSMKGVDSLIIFDAHLDLRSEFMDTRVNHTTWLRRLLERKDFRRVIVIGARAYVDEEEEFAEEKGVDVVSSREAFFNFGQSIRKVESLINDAEEVYLSIDIDVLDPGCAPGVGNPEPGGLSPIQLFTLIELVSERLELRGIDVVEVNPLFDNGLAAANAVYAVYRALLASATKSS